MSAKEDVFGEHELRYKLLDLLDSYGKDLEKLAMNHGRVHWPPHPIGWEEKQSVIKLQSDYLDDMIKEVKECQMS